MPNLDNILRILGVRNHRAITLILGPFKNTPFASRDQVRAIEQDFYRLRQFPDL